MLNRIVTKISLMYSDENTTFSKEFLKKVSKGEFIDDKTEFHKGKF